MVTQESFLFSGTVADNIAFGRPDGDRAEIEAAAGPSGRDDFITCAPRGLRHRRRQARAGGCRPDSANWSRFARAFLADPAVLILDEATSSLDIPSERRGAARAATLLADRTALIIAHRLSTVEIADRVLVMEAGRVVEDGSPDELIAGGGRYADLHRAWRDSLV